MRRTRWFLLVAIVAVAAAVTSAYLSQKARLQSEAPIRPKALPENVSATATKWVWSERVNGNSSVELRANSFQQVKQPAHFELHGVELRIFDKTNTQFDLVKSAKAKFNPADATLFSEGDVEITMNVPADGRKAGRIIDIRSSGVTFNSRTGTATTDRPTKFRFDQGEGESVGAAYDSTNRELHLRSAVRITWNGASPTAKPMTVEAGEMIYKEVASHILLFPWSRLTREGLTLNAGDATVNLKEGTIDSVDSKDAQGVDKTPGRQVEFGAKELHMEFTEKGLAKKVSGVSEARLISSSDAAQTTVTSDRMDLEFEPGAEESALKTAQAFGRGVVESRPVPRANAALPETRVLRSEVILLKMRGGGKEIASVETNTPGQIEFVPNRPGQRHRNVTGDRIWITYGAENQIEKFRSVNVKTRTDPEKKDASPSTTTSRDMTADFDPKTGQMACMEQWGDFRYEEGPRKATAERALMEAGKNLVTLTQRARVWDDTGSVSASRIVLDQKSGDFSAEGDVMSSRSPEKKGGSGMLSKDEPVQATASRMQSRERNQQVHYEGSAVMWQGANRIQADRIDIDRKNDTLSASGKVVTQFADKPKPGEKQPQAAVYTVVRAPKLIYTDADRLAHYAGGSRLVRPGLDVTAQEIRAWLKREQKPGTAQPKGDEARAPDEQSGLDKVFADGKVVIVQRTPQRTRQGTGEHSEYYADDEKVILTGGNPLLVDSLRGQSRGKTLTWFTRDDRLLVDNTGSGPAVSRLKKK